MYINMSRKTIGGELAIKKRKFVRGNEEVKM